jgi:hypothetical protein
VPPTELVPGVEKEVEEQPVLQRIDDGLVALDLALRTVDMSNFSIWCRKCSRTPLRIDI